MTSTKRMKNSAIISFIFIFLFLAFSINSVMADEDDKVREKGDASFSFKYYYMHYNGGDDFYTNNNGNLNGIMLHGDLWLNPRGAFEVEYFHTFGDVGPLGYKYPDYEFNAPLTPDMSVDSLTIGSKLKLSKDKEYLSDFVLVLNYRWLDLSRSDHYLDEVLWDFDGFGFGFKKEACPSRKYDVFGQLVFYPGMDNGYLDMEVLTYEIGFSMKWSDHIRTEFSYRGEDIEMVENSFGQGAPAYKFDFLSTETRLDGITASIRADF